MTRTSLVILLLSLPGIASAQIEEITPPEATPAPPAAPPPQAVPPHEAAAPPSAAPPSAAPFPAAMPAPPTIQLTRYSRYRTSWYIGFGIGGGGGWVSADGSSQESDKRGGVALTILKVGWVAQPWLLIGFEGGAWRHDEDGYWVQFNHYDAVATFFPIFDRGLYGKVGAGAGVAVVGARDIVGLGEVSGHTDTGFDLKLGLGYEWQLLRSFNLGLDLSYAMTAYDDGKTHDLTAQLTFTWY